MKDKKTLNIQIGARIKAARESERYTQAQLAEIIDISPQFVSDMERGVVGISFETLIKICRALHVSADWLLLGSTDYSPSLEIIADKLRPLNAAQLRAINSMIDSALSLIPDNA